MAAAVVVVVIGIVVVPHKNCQLCLLHHSRTRLGLAGLSGQQLSCESSMKDAAHRRLEDSPCCVEGQDARRAEGEDELN